MSLGLRDVLEHAAAGNQDVTGLLSTAMRNTAERSAPDMVSFGTVVLYADSELGYVAVRFGASKMTSQGMVRCVPAAPTPQAEATSLSIEGAAFEIRADLVHAPLPDSPFASVRALLSAQAAGDDDPALNTARSYQQQLNDSPAGREHVAIYYRNNAAINDIVRGDNPFSRNLATPTYRAMGNQTLDAAQNPDDKSHAIGDDQYKTNALSQHLRFVAACAAAAGQSGLPLPPQAYKQAAADSQTFKSLVTTSDPYNQQSPLTVGAVMSYVGTAPTQRKTAAFETTQWNERIEAQARLDAERSIEAFAAAGNTSRTYSELAQYYVPLGGATISVVLPEITMTIPSDRAMPARIEAGLPLLSLRSNQVRSATLATAASALSAAGFVRRIVSSKICLWLEGIL